MDKLSPFAEFEPVSRARFSPGRMARAAEECRQKFGDGPCPSIFDAFLEEYGDTSLAHPYEPITPEESVELKRHIAEMEAYIKSLPPCEYPSR